MKHLIWIIVVVLCWSVVACAEKESVRPIPPTVLPSRDQFSQRIDEIGVSYRVPNNFTAEEISSTGVNFYASGDLPEGEKLFLTLEMLPRQGQTIDEMKELMSSMLNSSAEGGEIVTDTIQIGSWQPLKVGDKEADSADLISKSEQKQSRGHLILIEVDAERVLLIMGLASRPSLWQEQGVALNALRDSIEFYEPSAEFAPDGTLILPPPNEPGVTRNNPLSITPVIELPNWAITISETVRGAEAAAKLNVAPPEDQQYLLIHLIVTNRYSENEFPQNIDEYDFFVTGSRRLRYGSVSVTGFAMPLNTNLINGQSAEAWIAFLVGADEQALQLVFDEAVNLDRYSERYIALDAGTKIEDDPTLSEIPRNVTLTTRENPFSADAPFVGKDWQLDVLDQKRGDAAIAFLAANEAYFEPAQKGMEYLLVQLNARYIGTNSTPQPLNFNHFRVTGELKQLYELPSISLVSGELNEDFYPGGERSGWLLFEVGANEGNLLLQFKPDENSSADYIALQPNAKVVTSFTPPTPNEIGNSAESPATAEETIITNHYEVTPLTLLRGESAYEFLQTASPHNLPLEGNLEYVAVQLQIHAIFQGEQSFLVNVDDFKVIATGDVTYSAPYVIAPEPMLSADLFADGRHEGWLVMQVPRGDTQASLLFDNNTAEVSDDRYIALNWNQ